jgi:hypothetical protein
MCLNDYQQPVGNRIFVPAFPAFAGPTDTGSFEPFTILGKDSCFRLVERRGSRLDFQLPIAADWADIAGKPSE